jgi:hypothetical protein
VLVESQFVYAVVQRYERYLAGHFLGSQFNLVPVFIYLDRWTPEAADDGLVPPFYRLQGISPEEALLDQPAVDAYAARRLNLLMKLG